MGYLTLFGIMTSCCALLIEPDSSLPRITVPMSWWDRLTECYRAGERRTMWLHRPITNRIHPWFTVEGSHLGHPIYVLSVYEVFYLCVCHYKRWLWQQPINNSEGVCQINGQFRKMTDFSQTCMIKVLDNSIYQTLNYNPSTRNTVHNVALKPQQGVIL